MVKTVYWIIVLIAGRTKNWVEILRSDLDYGFERENKTDAELRKHREQKGLETPVVYAVNDVH